MYINCKSKLEIIIIILLFSILTYLIYDDRILQKNTKIKELCTIIQQQNNVIKNYEQYKNLDDVGLQIKQIKEEIEKYHNHN